MLSQKIKKEESNSFNQKKREGKKKDNNKNALIYAHINMTIFF